MTKQYKISFKESVYLRLIEVAEIRDLKPLECLYTLVNEERDRLRGLGKKSERSVEVINHTEEERVVEEKDFDLFE